MKKSELKKLMEKYGVEEFEYEDVCDFVSDLLEMMADEIKENDPYDESAVKDYKRASYLVFALVDNIQEILDEES